MLKSLAIITIGRTGAEVVAAHLASNPALAILPGQNFCGGGDALYRPAPLESKSPEEVFDYLISHCYGRVTGLAWLGLTKWMSKEDFEDYLRQGHRKLFLDTYRGGTSFLEAANHFASTYFRSRGESLEKFSYYGHFSNNFPICLAAEDFSGDNTIFLDCYADPSLWIALISESLTWDPVSALNFWIVNRLCFEKLQRSYPNSFRKVNVRDFFETPDVALAKLEEDLNLHSCKKNIRINPIGFPVINEARLNSLLESSMQIDQILRGSEIYELALSLEVWADEFLKEDILLEKYIKYWRSTTHIAFDISSFIHDQIINKAKTLHKYDKKENFSFDFYHKKIKLNSRNFLNPTHSHSHCLGILEDELIIPCLPYYLRCCILYLKAVLDSHNYDPWTYSDLRKNRLYKKLISESYSVAFIRFGIYDLLEDLESEINIANEAYNNTHASKRKLRDNNYE